MQTLLKIHTLKRSRTHTHTHTHAHIHTHTHTRTRTLSLSNTHTHTRTCVCVNTIEDYSSINLKFFPGLDEKYKDIEKGLRTELIINKPDLYVSLFSIQL